MVGWAGSERRGLSWVRGGASKKKEKRPRTEGEGGRGEEREREYRRHVSYLWIFRLASEKYRISGHMPENVKIPGRCGMALTYSSSPSRPPSPYATI